MLDKTKLTAAGIDYDEGVERFGGRPEIFEKYLKKFFDSDFMETIERQLENKDISGAFRTTHDLKGATGNLSLNRCYQAICELTELLRSGDPASDYQSAFNQVKHLYEMAASAVREAEQ